MGLMSVGAGSRAKLLWTNPAPSSSFGAQSISVEMDGYDAFLVLGMDGSCILNNRSGASNVLFGKFGFWNSKDYNLSCRSVTRGTSKISFSDCKIMENTQLNTGVFNQNCVPQKIYGIKF